MGVLADNVEVADVNVEGVWVDDVGVATGMWCSTLN